MFDTPDAFESLKSLKETLSYGEPADLRSIDELPDGQRLPYLCQRVMGRADSGALDAALGRVARHLLTAYENPDVHISEVTRADLAALDVDGLLRVVTEFAADPDIQTQDDADRTLGRLPLDNSRYGKRPAASAHDMNGQDRDNQFGWFEHKLDQGQKQIAEMQNMNMQGGDNPYKGFEVNEDQFEANETRAREEIASIIQRHYPSLNRQNFPEFAEGSANKLAAWLIDANRPVNRPKGASPQQAREDAVNDELKKFHAIQKDPVKVGEHLLEAEELVDYAKLRAHIASELQTHKMRPSTQESSSQSTFEKTINELRQPPTTSRHGEPASFVAPHRPTRAPLDRASVERLDQAIQTFEAAVSAGSTPTPAKPANKQEQSQQEYKSSNPSYLHKIRLVRDDHGGRDR